MVFMVQNYLITNILINSFVYRFFFFGCVFGLLVNILIVKLLFNGKKVFSKLHNQTQFHNCILLFNNSFSIIPTQIF